MNLDKIDINFPISALTPDPPHQKGAHRGLGKAHAAEASGDYLQVIDYNQDKG